jgi:4,5-dihydroxyphthalate decarboxylase
VDAGRTRTRRGGQVVIQYACYGGQRGFAADAVIPGESRACTAPREPYSDRRSDVPRLRLTLACWNYDRTRALLEERVRPDGIDLTYLSLPVEETFFRMLRHREFDAAEMSLSSYVVSRFKPERPFIAIPVFPSRCFRHSCIYVNADAGIRQPGDLIGRKIGTPEFQMTASVWIRGTLAEWHGVTVNSAVYYTGGEEEPGRPEKIPLDLPPDIRVQPIGAGQTLSAMLARGEIDALYTARTPSTFEHGSGTVRRLFEDFVATEREYYRRTRIFPIMHTVVIRRDLYERHPWVARSLYKAFDAARREVYDDLRQTAALKTMLPWLIAHVEEARREMGDDFWPYGLEANRHTLTTFLRYAHEQGLAGERLEPEQLFAPETLEAFKV